ncbi:KAP family P-loop domain protein [Pseudovibrio sp. Ad46]|uniref:P-loop NTPase fold protein n=1 Tax=Pseudovibrio sp. Ad46 TaxID=989432 RepID=UPI0007AEE00C|nr:P-loop NTPase fold protein [Pseudovibrio sp. Ad46]KZK80871.1 KAP family P-loop domain protein [Pseudovibrio sp. Ad46]
MEIHCDGIAIIEKNGSKEKFEVFADELDWEVTGGEERGMGPSTTFEAIVDHDDLGRLSWVLTEYPVGAQNYNNTDVGKHRLIQDLDYRLEHEPELDFDSLSETKHKPSDVDIALVTPDHLLQWFKQNAHIVRSIPLHKVTDAIESWFHHYYEGPENELFYDKEDGYIYIYGGPYGAEEEIRDQFEEFVTDEVIKSAVSSLERGGTVDWAPSPNHPNQIAAAREDEAEQEDLDSNSTQGAGVHLKREPENLVLNSDRFALSLAHLFRTAKGEFSLALLGRWGSGKTSIAKQICVYLQEHNSYKSTYMKVFGEQSAQGLEEVTYDIVKFNAWRYRQRPELWIWLYESFINSFLSNKNHIYVLRTMRAGIEKNGFINTLLTLVILALSAVPFMWLSLLIPHGVALFGVTGVVGMFILIRKWSASLRSLFDRYGIVTSHREHLGMQALIGEDLAILIKAWTKQTQFTCWQKRLFGFVTFTISLVWLASFTWWKNVWVIESLRAMGIDGFALYTGAASITSITAWILWTLLCIAFGCAIFSESGRVDRIFLVVDDLDRCPDEEVVDLIDGVKLMIDEEQIGKFVQAMILADNTVLEAAILKRFSDSSNEKKQEDTKGKAAIREHMEKVFLCHVCLPPLTSQGVGELVNVFSKEFGLEPPKTNEEKKHRFSEGQKRETGQHSTKPSSEQKKVDFILSIAERNQIRISLSNSFKSSGEVVTPRAVRSFFFKYQLARMLLHSNGVTHSSEDLVEKLCKCVADARMNGRVSEKAQDDDPIGQVVSLIA